MKFLTVLLVVIYITLGKNLKQKIKNRRNERNERNGKNTDNRPNILFIIVDDLGWGDVPSHNNNQYYLPQITEEIYGKGIEFTRYYTAPVCTPTRASFMTGKYAWKLGLQDVQTMPPCVDERIPVETATLPQLLQTQGYSTYYVGKWHLGYAKWSDTPIGRGFDHAYGYLQGEGDYYQHYMHLEDIKGYDMFDLDNQQADWDVFGEYAQDIYDRKAKEYFSNHEEGADLHGQPFYMYLSVQTIHEPIQIPHGEYPNHSGDCAGISHNENRNIYCQKMMYLDDSLGSIIQDLKNKGLYDNTLIVFTTDNGGMVPYDHADVQETAFYMPNSYGCNAPYRAGKATLFEGGIHGIGLLAGNLIDPSLQGTQDNTLIHAVDWFTTILEGAAGVTDIPSLASSIGKNDGLTYDGVNLLNYVCSSDQCSSNTFPREFIYPNIDITNALMPQQTEVTITKSFRMRKTQVTTTETVTMDLSDGYGDMPFDAVIYYDSTTQKFWKMIRGYSLYYNFYDCNGVKLNDGLLQIPDHIWDTTTEWFFEITKGINELEYESGNYLSPTFEGEITDDIQQIIDLLRSKLDEQANSSEFRAEQEGTRFDFHGLPYCSEGTFEPWLQEDGTPFVDLLDCDYDCDWDCVISQLRRTTG